MTSHASVNLMLALEDHFDVEFPDEMLTRSAFESISSIRSSARLARGRQRSRMSSAANAASTSTFLASVERDRRRRGGANGSTRSIARRGSPTRRSMRCARRRRSRPSSRGSSAAGASRWTRSQRLLHPRQALRRHRDGLRHAPDPGRLHRPAPERQRLVPAVSARPRRRPAADRLGDLRGWDRRRHGPLGRRAWRREDDGTCSFEKQAPTVSYGSQADDLLTTLRRGAGCRRRRPGRRAHPQGAGRARADGDVGSVRHARHVLPGIHDPRLVRAGAGAARGRSPR